jgi:folate-dependent phosphoribosylglycinamide formyltransferase PurN
MTQSTIDQINADKRAAQIHAAHAERQAALAEHNAATSSRNMRAVNRTGEALYRATHKALAAEMRAEG